MHLGKKVHHRAQALRIGPTELSGLINTSKPNIYTIYKRESMDSKMLMQLSVALKYNFFKELSQDCEVRLAGGNTEEELAGYVPEIDRVKNELQEFKEKYALLKELYKSKTGESF